MNEDEKDLVHKSFGHMIVIRYIIYE